MFTFQIALRFFLSKKAQTVLIVLGFAIGISVNIFVGSLIQSLQDDLLDSTIGDQPHIIISQENQTFIEDWKSLMPELDKIDEIQNKAAALDGRVFIMNINDDSPDDILLRGFNLSDADEIYKIFSNEKFVGTVPKVNQVVIGADLQTQLELEIGDKLVIQQDPQSNNQSTEVSISGIFDLGVKSINSLWVYAPYNLVENILNSTGMVSSINIQIKDAFQSEKVAIDIRNINTNSSLQVIDWKEQNESLLSGLQAQSSSTLIIQTFVLLAVVIGIASILGITVLQKSRQIGILKAMGLSNSKSALIFLFEGLLFGLIGSFLGALIGWLLIWSFNTFAGGKDAGLFDIRLNLNFVIVTIVVSIISSVAASLIPARASSNMEVIDIIRNN